MNENRALYRGVLRRPEDDAPRSSYADWLCRRRDPRGDFIRAQLAQHRLRSTPGAWRIYEETTETARALEVAHGAQWYPRVRPLCDDFRCDRGFVDGVTLTAERFLEVADALFDVAPVLHLRVTQARGLLAQVAAHPRFGQIVSLNLMRSGVDDRDIAGLCDAGNARRLAWLSLSFCDVGIEAIEALFTTANLPRLQQLAFAGNRCPDPSDQAAMEQGRFVGYTASDFGAGLEARFGSRPWLRKNSAQCLFDLPTPEYYVGRR